MEQDKFHYLDTMHLKLNSIITAPGGAVRKKKIEKAWQIQVC